MPTTTKARVKVKREKSTSTANHYVRNADLIPAILEAKELGRVTDKLMGMIKKIAEGYSRKSWFIGYSFREDMVSAAVENLVKNALKFDHVRYNNPFAFYTTAIHRSFLQFLADEKKHRNIRDKLRMEAGANPSFNFMEAERDERHFEIQESDDHYVEPVEELVDGEVVERPVEEDKRDGSEVPREEKVQFISRAPSVGRKYGPGDFDVDPVTGAVTIKPEAVARYEKLEAPAVVEEPPKKQRKPRAPKGATIPEKKLTPLARAKKVAAEKKPKAEKKLEGSPLAKVKNLKPVKLPEKLTKPRATAKPKVVDEKIATTRLKKPAVKKPAAAKKTTKSTRG